MAARKAIDVPNAKKRPKAVMPAGRLEKVICWHYGSYNNSRKLIYSFFISLVIEFSKVELWESLSAYVID